MIHYTEDAADVDASMLTGFFVGWPRRPSAAQHLDVLRGSFRVMLAIDDATDRVAGFVNMISDGVLTAFIPWLEVRAVSGARRAPSGSRFHLANPDRRARAPR